MQHWFGRSQDLIDKVIWFSTDVVAAVSLSYYLLVWMTREIRCFCGRGWFDRGVVVRQVTFAKRQRGFVQEGSPSGGPW